MRVVYFGDGPWAHRALHAVVAAKFEVALVVTRYPKGDEVLSQIAGDYGIPVTCQVDVNRPDFYEQEYCRADLGVSMSFDQIFRSQLLNHFPGGIINCHAGKLPHYRGRNILNWALINDEAEIGVTCHYVNAAVDCGDILVQRCFPLTDEDDYASVLQRATELCPEVLMEALLALREGSAKSIPQVGPGSYFVSRRVGDEWIDWKSSAREIFNFVRAITLPGPCARSWIRLEEGAVEVKVRKVALPDHGLPYICIPGAVIGISERGNPLVKTNDTHVELLDYEVLGSTRRKLRVGDRLAPGPSGSALSP